MTAVEMEEADALLEQAHRSGYRYPDSFAGFEAVLSVDLDGVNAEGAVCVRIEDGNVSAEAPGSEVPWAAEQLRSMVAHRLGRPYAEGDGRFAKRVTHDGNPLGVLVELDDAMASSYRLADGQIAQVTRAPQGRRFSIFVQERSPAGGGTLLPKEFAVFYWSADGALEAAEAYSDRYEEVDSLLLPASRRVVRADANGTTTRQLTLRTQVLIEGGAS